MTSEYLPTTCVITTPGAPNPVDNGATRGPAVSVTLPCRFRREQARVTHPDGSIELAGGQLYAPADAAFPSDCLVTVNGETFRALSVKTDVDAYGHVVGVRVLLG